MQVRDALVGANQVAAGQRRVGTVRTDEEIATHAGGEVDDHIDVGLADATDNVAIEIDATRRNARLGLAHVAVDDRRTGLGSVDCRVRNLLRSNRQFGMDALRRTGSGDSAGDKGVPMHGGVSSQETGRSVTVRCSTSACSSARRRASSLAYPIRGIVRVGTSIVSWSTANGHGVTV